MRETKVIETKREMQASAKAKTLIVDYVKCAFPFLDAGCRETIIAKMRHAVKGDNKRPRPFVTKEGFVWTRRLILKIIQKRYKEREATKLTRKIEDAFFDHLRCTEAATAMCDLSKGSSSLPSQRGELV